MTTPIKPMNAVEAVNSINECITSTTRIVIKSAMSGRPYDSQFDQRLRNTILKALASHLAYVKEKLEPYEKTMTKGYGGMTITETHEKVRLCLAVLQSEIDELTK